MVPPVGAGNKSKYLLRQFPIIRFYGALALSLVFFFIQIVVANIAHSLILQIDAYHMVYNILSLITCIVTAKMSKRNTLKNTFGWRRIDIGGAISSLVFLAALGFSVFVESVQAMLHASHHEKMCCAITVGTVGVLGLLVNFVIYLLIGGYTLHQSGFLCPAKDNREDESVISAAMRRGPYDHVMRERQGIFETFRDVFGCVLVIACAVVVYFDEDSADYVDPSLTIITVTVLALTSFKYGREAGYILLLTIPDQINVDTLQGDIKKQFPEVANIHELHVWQLTRGKIVATLHVVLKKPQGYLNIQNKIIHFLHTHGISHVTMQPEFVEMNEGEAELPEALIRNKCFLPCRCDDEDCQGLRCCNDGDEHDHSDHDHSGHFENEDPDHVHFRHPQHQHGSSSIGSVTLNSSNSHVQSPSSTSAQSTDLDKGLKSDSLNNHLALSLDTISSTKEVSDISKNKTLGSTGNGQTYSDESSDDEQVQAELRPMI